jgi:hypothetical protein
MPQQFSDPISAKLANELINTARMNLSIIRKESPFQASQSTTDLIK